MLRILSYVIIITCIWFLFSCNQNKETLDKKSVFNHYTLPEDSLKRKALTFVVDNIDSHNSDIPVFTKRLTKEEIPFDLNSIENDTVFKRTIKRLKLKPSYRTVTDNSIVDNTFLLKDIDLAFDLWNKYPWADQVPFDIFLNYLLPYKVYGEEPCNWRSFFQHKYRDTIYCLMNNLEMEAITQSTNEIYYQFLVNDVGQWFVYNPNPFVLTRYPGLNELMALKSGDCVGRSYLNVMILRSLGIPSTVDFVPYWGRKNGTHQSEVFWDNEMQMFRTASGRNFQFPAKVLRYTFKKQNRWTDSIKPVIKRKSFMLDYLKHDHWLDATHEHTKTATIEYDCNASSGFAYICVFNYGQWVPAFWGKVKDGKVRFENMGTAILYRVAIPENNSFKLISPVFRLDETGDKTFFKPNSEGKINFHLTKLNTGAKSWVEAGKNYSLYYYDEDKEWTLLETKRCENDSLIVFERIPSNTLYQLLEIEQEKGLERIFTYENGEQVWW